MNLKSLLSPQYLFTFNAANISPQEKLFGITGCVLALLAIVCYIAAKLAPTPVDQTYRKKLYRLFLTIGLSEILWYGLRYENVNFLGTPFIAWLIVLWGLVWLAFLLVDFFRHYGSSKQTWEKEQLKLKYLPK